MSDYAIVKGEETLAVYDNLADAVQLWRSERRAGARILNLLGNGKVYAAVIGDARVRDRGNPKARKSWVRTVPVGWTRLVPPQREDYAFGLGTDDVRSLFPGKIVVGRRTEAERRVAAARRRKRTAARMEARPMSKYPEVSAR